MVIIKEKFKKHSLKMWTILKVIDIYFSPCQLINYLHLKSVFIDLVSYLMKERIVINIKLYEINF